MNIVRKNGLTALIADEGKVLKRKGDNFIYGKIVTLGYSFFMNGVKLNKPHLDTPEDFEEINDTQGGNE